MKSIDELKHLLAVIDGYKEYIYFAVNYRRIPQIDKAVFQRLQYELSDFITSVGMNCSGCIISWWQGLPSARENIVQAIIDRENESKATEVAEAKRPGKRSKS